MGRKKTVDYEVQNWSTPLMTRFLDRPRSPSTGSHIRSVLVFTIDSAHLASDDGPLQYDVPELRTLALNHIRGELAKCDIVEESFSRFASE